MQLSDLSKIASDQEAGHAFELVDPVHGKPIGITVTVAGPDSQIARKARIDLERELARLTSRKATVAPEAREDLVNAFLCAVTLGWTATEDGQPVPFTEENLMRLLKAGTWVRAQLDSFAGDRAPYFDGEA